MSDTPPLFSPYPASPGLSIGQALDRIFKLFRTQFVFFIRLGVLPAAAMLILYAPLFGALFLAGFFTPAGQPPAPRALAVFFIGGTVTGVALMCIYALYEAAACHAALLANDGIAVTVRDAFRAATHKVGRLVSLMILRTLIVALPIIVIAALIMGAAALLGAFHSGRGSDPSVVIVVFPLMMLLYLGCMVYAVFAMLRLALAVPACVAEELTATESLKRSLQMTKHAKGRIFLVLLVVYAASSVATLLLETVMVVVAMVGMLLGMSFHVQLSPPWSYVGIGFLAAIACAVFFIFIVATWGLYSIAFCVLYQDQRKRLEGSAPPLAGEPA
jgi:hypothetical protein